MNEYLNGKVAVITGAGGTICSEVAIDLAKNGVKLALVGRTTEKLEKTANAIKEIGGECFVFACDVCDAGKIEELADKVYETYIYCYDGWLWELYTEEGFAVSVSDGEKILPLKDFVAEFDTTQHMIKIRVQLVDEKWQDFNIYLHSGKEIGK